MDKALVDLSEYRLNQARQCIKSAHLLVDNDDYFVISKSDVKQQIENAEYFYRKIEAYLQVRYSDYLME